MNVAERSLLPKRRNFFNNPRPLLQWLHGKQQQQQKFFYPNPILPSQDYRQSLLRTQPVKKIIYVNIDIINKTLMY